MRCWRSVAVFAAFLSTALVAIPSAAAAPPAPSGWNVPASDQSKLARSLQPAATGRRPAPASADAQPGTQPDDQGRVDVEVFGDPSKAASAVGDAGGAVSSASDHFVAASVPATSLSSLAADDRVDAVIPARRPSTAVVQQSQGVSQTGANTWQAAGIDGTGIKVGVLDVGFTNLASEQTAGAFGVASVTTNAAGCNGNLNGTTSHGTGVAEIVHQMAPGASLFLACITNDSQASAAETWFAQNGVRVVNASIGDPLDGRGDGTGGPGTLAGAAAQGRADGQLWSVAAGNDGLDHFSFVGNDADNDGAVEFGPGNPDSGPDPTEFLTFSLQSGGTADILMKFDAWPATSQQFELCLFAGTPGNNPTPIADFSGQPGCPGNPANSAPIAEWFNTGMAAGTYTLAILHPPSTTIHPRIDLYFHGTESGISRIAPQGSLWEPATSPSTMAVGAYPVNNPGVIEPFSSEGPTIDGRIKPDIAGPDNVANDIFNPFLGTSAATPHVTGAAALVLQTNPNLSPALLQSSVQGLSLDAGPPGMDVQFGTGRLNLNEQVSGGPAEVVVNGAEQQYVRATDGSLWQRLPDGSWNPLGGFLFSDPAVAVVGTRVEVFVRGADNSLWHRISTDGGATFGQWTSLGGIITAAPSAVSWGPNRIDVFVRGQDNALWHNAWLGGTTFSGWQGLGGGLTSAPDVSSWGTNRLDVFIRGLDNALWHIAWNGSVWSAWQGLGGGLASGPGATSVAFNTIDVFATGLDGQIWTRQWNGSVWVNWLALGGAAQGDPAAAGISQPDVLVNGRDGALWQKVRNPNGTWPSGGSLNGWASLGSPTP